MRLERLRRRAARDRLHHRRLDFAKTARVQKIANFANDRDPLFKHLARFFIGDQVEVTLPIALLDIREAIPRRWHRPQRFAQEGETLDAQRWLAGLGDKTFALDSDEVGQIDQLEDFHLLRSEFLPADKQLHPPARVAQIEEVAFAHVAMRRDAARHPLIRAFHKSRADFTDSARGVEAPAKRLHAQVSERFEFLPAHGDQVVGFFHDRAADCGASR